jgi:hypothetical protein
LHQEEHSDAQGHQRCDGQYDSPYDKVLQSRTPQLTSRSLDASRQSHLGEVTIARGY